MTDVRRARPPAAHSRGIRTAVAVLLAVEVGPPPGSPSPGASAWEIAAALRDGLGVPGSGGWTLADLSGSPTLETLRQHALPRALALAPDFAALVTWPPSPFAPWNGAGFAAQVRAALAELLPWGPVALSNWPDLPAHAGNAPWQHEARRRTAAANGALARAAADLGAALVDPWAGGRGLWTPDGLHLREEGVRALGAALAAAAPRLGESRA